MQTIPEKIKREIPLHQLSMDCQFRIFPLENYSANKFAHRHDFYEILWLQQEDGKHLIDFSEYSLKSNHIFFLKPGQINKFTSETVKGYIIDFNEEFFYREPQDKLILSELHQTPYIKLLPESEATIRSLIGLIYNEYLLKNYCSNLLRAYLKALLINLVRGVENTPNLPNISSDIERVACLNSLLEDNFRVRKDTRFYADSLSLTPKRLNEVIKQVIGKTVTQLIHNRLILEAKRELAFSQHSVKNIAFELGFEDPPYFSRFFKKITGIYPQQYRNKWFK